MGKHNAKDLWIIIGSTGLGSGLSALMVEHSGSVGPLAGLWAVFALVFVEVNALRRDLRRLQEEFVKSQGKA